MSLHRESSGQSNIHVPHAFEFANSTDRAAGTGYTITASDVKKLALQLDDYSLWVLSDDSPLTWVAIGSSSALDKVRVRNTAAQTLANDTSTALTFDTEIYDVGGLHSTSVNTSRLTAVKSTRKYHIWGTMGFVGNSTGQRQLFIRLNGATTQAVTAVINLVATDIYMCVSCDMELASGDYVELFAYQNSGGNLDTKATNPFTPTFGMHELL